jgi:trk system potassium uptake protein TrkH
LKHAATLAPLYTGLTVTLAILQIAVGEGGFVALCHSMSLMATSGISPVGGVDGGVGGRGAEMLMFLFMIFALSRLAFSSDTAQAGYSRLDRDPEFRIGMLVVFATTLILFARHFLSSYDMGLEENLTIAFHAFWGGLFTTMSYLTTTGFVSADWDEIQNWSGLGSPGMILMGLSVIGGGVATTAGGVKLLRVWALYLNGLREMDRLMHPSAVVQLGGSATRVQQDGAFLAWVFFMLFALSLAGLSVGFSALGMGFDQSLVLAVSGLSTTGPLIQMGTDAGLAVWQLGAGGKFLYCFAMVLGRLETLALIALFTPDLWRN